MSADRSPRSPCQAERQAELRHLTWPVDLLANTLDRGHQVLQAQGLTSRILEFLHHELESSPVVGCIGSNRPLEDRVMSLYKALRYIQSVGHEAYHDTIDQLTPEALEAQLDPRQLEWNDEDDQTMGQTNGQINQASQINHNSPRQINQSNQSSPIVVDSSDSSDLADGYSEEEMSDGHDDMPSDTDKSSGADEPYERHLPAFAKKRARHGHSPEHSPNPSPRQSPRQSLFSLWAVHPCEAEVEVEVGVASAYPEKLHTYPDHSLNLVSLTSHRLKLTLMSLCMSIIR